MKRTVLISIGMIFLVPVLGIPQSPTEKGGGQWSVKRPMPTARSGAAAAVVDGKIYVFGGYFARNDKSRILSVLECYDPATDRWRRLAPMPTARSGAVAAVVAGKIYVIGGVDENQEFVATNERYDPQTGRWKAVAPMPTARAVPAVAVVHDRIYAIGGVAKADKAGQVSYSDLAVNEEYDPAADSWRARDPMPTKRPRPVAAACKDKVYVIGGGEKDRSVVTNINERYDPAADSWRIRRPMATARSAAAAEVVDGKIYVMGGYRMLPAKRGERAQALFLSDVQEYDPASDLWTGKTAMASARGGMVSGVIKGRIYLIGGFNEEKGYLRLNEEYDMNKAGAS